MTELATVIEGPDEATTLRQAIDAISNQLCRTVDGKFDLFIESDVEDHTIQKLSMLINFLVDTARRSIARSEEQNERFKELDRLKSDFLGKISHEFRTPLTLILGPTEARLQQDNIDPDIEAFLLRIQRNGMRLFGLVNDLLDFSKIEAGQVALSAYSLNIVDTIRLLVEDIEPLATSRGLSLSLDTQVEHPRVVVDGKLLEKSILNLLSNAIKFTPSPGRVHVDVNLVDERLRISVEDTGIGIDEAALATLFEPFTQADNSLTRLHEGTGLGLTLVKSFVEVMGGRIDVQSELGSGSVFTMTLPVQIDGSSTPLARPESSMLGTRAFQRRVAMEAPAVAAQKPPRQESDTQPTILVAEDDPDLRLYFQETLGDFVTVLTAENGVRAWALLQRRPVDVVILDVMMPDLDGVEILRRIKEHPQLKATPVILVTARGGLDALSDGLENGANDYLMKPFYPRELRARVRAAIRMTQLQDDLRERARDAGMEHVAVGVLHNVGNVLNSVNVSVASLSKHLEASKVSLLNKLSQLLDAETRCDRGRSTFLVSDPRGQKFPKALTDISSRLLQERDYFKQEVAQLTDHLEHMTEVVRSQQSLARDGMSRTWTSISQVVDRAILIGAVGCSEAGIEIETAYGNVPPMLLDAHRVIQILVNLITNAKRAVSKVGRKDPRIRISTEFQGYEAAVIIIEDNGIGIAPNHLHRIFEHGFTTEPSGHGFGLHTSVNAARQLGGDLSVRSNGLNLGAVFTLVLPLGDPSDV